ncbi:hypothetical protein CDAR_500391 [Caerostris darwini]|uniref:DNA mismatch repair protein n=1 Tax=Caerostris darwini TaxID=1538125 RepID=A0AAV4M7R2_9ARAC|nr:hypothetical protein CDAR_500391 [Caerostris darwini]
MSKQKSLFDFFKKSPATKSPNGEISTSDTIRKACTSTTASESSQPKSSNSVKRPAITSSCNEKNSKSLKSPEKLENSQTPKSSRFQSNGSISRSREKKQSQGHQDSEEEERKEEESPPRKKVKRRRIVIASESEDSDEYKPEKDGKSSDSSISSNKFSETESPEKKKKTGKENTPSPFLKFSNPKSSPINARRNTSFSTDSPKQKPTSGRNSKSSTPVSKKSEKNFRPSSDPNYNPRTLHVPQDFKKTLTPAMKQWWDLKTENFDTVLFFKVGKFYELYHMDAAIGVKELGLIYMKGDFAHSGFPEIAFGRYSECLIEKGYKVARVEQTETPQMMEERCKKMRHSTKYDKVVAREICQITSKGTRTLTYQDESMGISNNFLFAICEECTAKENVIEYKCKSMCYYHKTKLKIVMDNYIPTCFLRKHMSTLKKLRSSSKYGICFIDTSIGKFTLGQFIDDRHGSKLLTLVALYPPVEILYDKMSITKKTLQLLNHHLTGASKEALSSQFWQPTKVMKFLEDSKIFSKEDNSLEYPETLKKMLDPDDRLMETPLKDYELAFRSLGACLWYLKQCYIEDCLLSMKLFEEYIPLDEIQKELVKSSSDFNKHMVLDGVTLQNLEIVPLLSSDNSEGTLLGTMDYCSTSFGKRMFRNWLCSPLCNPDMISNRLDAIDDLVQIPEVVEATVTLFKKIPDLERLLSKIHAYGLSRSQDHPESRAIFYEADIYNKRKINDFLSTLEGFKQASEIVSLFKPHLNSFKDILTISNFIVSVKVIAFKEMHMLRRKFWSFPDMTETLNYFVEAFDHEEAKKQGSIIPSHGVDKEYDNAIAEINETKRELDTFLAQQKCTLNCKVSYVGSGKNRYLLEVPENKKVPRDFEFQGGRKGFKRYYTQETKDLLAQLIAAEENRASALKDITRRIFEHFDANFKMWKTAVHCLSTLDALLSLVLYYKSSGVTMCRPKFSIPSQDVEPHLEIIGGRHPTFLKYFTGDDYIPNSVYMGPKRDNELEDINSGGKLVLVTGPNMGGKSTLMRQAGTLVIMAHLGSYVPAESMCLTPVDRIFTRVGASDKISKGESTFFVEASETSSILHHATSDSFVLIDELGRGTSTYDGTAIAYAALDYLANDIGCRTLFSTHYHSLVEDFCGHPNVGLGHMACMVESELDCPALEKITFLYKFSDGACPKSYGFNVALLAGISRNVVRQGFLKAQQMEFSVKISKALRRLLSLKAPEEIIEALDKKYNFFHKE